MRPADGHADDGVAGPDFLSRFAPSDCNLYGNFQAFCLLGFLEFNSYTQLVLVLLGKKFTENFNQGRVGRAYKGSSRSRDTVLHVTHGTKDERRKFMKSEKRRPPHAVLECMLGCPRVRHLVPCAFASSATSYCSAAAGGGGCGGDVESFGFFAAASVVSGACDEAVGSSGL